MKIQASFLFVFWLTLASLFTTSSAFEYRMRHESATRSFPRTVASEQRLLRTNQYERALRPAASHDSSSSLAASLAADSNIDNAESTAASTPNQTVLSATFGLMKAILGSGCLALPYGLAAMSDHPSSLVAANLLLITLGVLSAYTFSLYGRLAHATGATSLGDLWKRIYNGNSNSSSSSTTTNAANNIHKDTSWIVSAANFIYCLGCCLTFSLIIGDSLSGLLKGTGLVSGIMTTRQASILAVTACVLLPLVQLQSLAALAPVSIIGVLGTIVIAAFMTMQCPAIVKSSPYNAAAVALLSKSNRRLLQTVPLPPQFQTYHRLQSPAPLILVAMACVAWMAHFSAPDFYHSFATTKTTPPPPPSSSSSSSSDNNDADDNDTSFTSNAAALRKYNLTTFLGYGLVAIVNAVILSTGFLTFGGNSMGLILNNYSPLDRGASLSRVLVLISMLGGFPFVFQGCLSSAMDLTTSKSSNGDASTTTPSSGIDQSAGDAGKRKRMTAILMSIITATSLVVRDAGFVVSFNGALMGTAIIYIVPSLLFLKLTSSSSPTTTAITKSKRWLRIERGFAKFLVVFGGVSAVLGAVTAVLNSYFPHCLR